MFKKLIERIGAAMLAVAMTAGIGYAQYNASNYSAQGGADWEVGSTLNIKTGGTFSFNGVAQSGAVRIGETALGGSNPTAVTTGLTTITGCALTIKTTSAPGVGTSVVTYGTSAGTLNLYGWKVTNSSTTTLIASTGTETIGWACTGT